VPGVTYVYPCRLGAVSSARADGVALAVAADQVHLPPGTSHAEIDYA
jgi:hypothetical protein